MALRLDDKRAIVAEVNETASQAVSAVLADYRGMTVADMTGLRVKARESGVTLRIVRNTLARRAVEGTEFECLRDALTGPTLLAFSNDDPGAAARLFKDAIKDHKALELKALAIGGQMYGPEDLEKVTSLPTREEALARLAGLMQAPVTKLASTLHAVPSNAARTLAAIPSKFVRTVQAVHDQKAAAGG